jgi:NADH dehydrogenase FAD-containing subunit
MTGGSSFSSTTSPRDSSHAQREVLVRAGAGQERAVPYDAIVIATGARPRTTGIQGIQLHGVYPLTQMETSYRVRERLGRVPLSVS